jgi:ankyrin repeat protein
MYSDGYDVFSRLDRWNQIRGPPRTKDVLDLFQRQPAAARHVGLGGRTLVHKCLEFYGGSLLTLLVLVEWYPEALLKPDDDGLLPIHTALANEHYPSLDAVRLLVEKCPEALLYEDANGRLPLHFACNSKFSRDQPVIEVLVSAFPDALEHPDNFGKYPLNYALEKDLLERAKPDTIEFLIDRCPSILNQMIPDSRGCLPLHSAATSSSASWVRTVQILAEHFPLALYMQTIHGQTPLALACMADEAYTTNEEEEASSLSVIYTLVRQWPEQVTTQSHLIFRDDDNGELLPVALASVSIRLKRVQNWTLMHPELLTIVDMTHGRLPIHYAVVSKSPDSLEIVQYLLDCLPPEALSRTDCYGRLPLHYACASNSAMPIVELLIDHYPEGLGVADVDGKLPWHYSEFANNELGNLLYERSFERFPDLDLDPYLVPDDVRWDIVQASL